MSWDARNQSVAEGDLVFQTLDWYTDDVEDPITGYPVYKIYAFGVDSGGSSLSLCINDFSPFFFIEVPTTWGQSCVYTVREALGIRSIKNMEFLKRKRYHGFENNKIRSFLKLSFHSYRGMKSARYLIEKNKYFISGKEYTFSLYESNIDPILRFTHLRDILTAGWVNVKGAVLDDTGIYNCSWTAIHNYPQNENIMSDIRVMFFDIEACSEDGSFPNALKPNDRVTQICCIIKDSVSGVTQKYLFNLGTCDPIDSTTVLQYPSEKKLLLNYAQFIRDTDPDVIVGYNIFGFDNGFLFERAQVLGIEEQFNYQSKLTTKRTVLEKKVLNNQQSGFNDWKMTKMYGRIHIDLLQVIKKDFKLESYRLNYVGEHFVGVGKDDVSPKEIFEAWDRTLGTREKRTIVGKYCVQDTNLCLLLFEKFAVLPNHLEMAKVTRVPLEYLITRGQSIKVFSQIAYETRKAGYLIPVLPRNETDSKFQGATVLEANIGHYTRPVCGLDFASLYPSIMIAHNMCYSTVVLDQKYNNLPGVVYSTIDCGGGMAFSFVQNQPGVLSGILQSLWKNRKITKKEMNLATDPFIKTVLNAKQLAIKVSMNSIYGFTGATVGALPCLEISQSVTGCGRQMIEQTQHHAKEMFKCEIVYGDSVSGDTPVLVRSGEIVEVIEIQILFKLFPKQEYPQFKSDKPGLFEKQQSIPLGLEVWTASGWSMLKRTIRHYCHKNMYRVITGSGIVDVSEDHSLLDVFLNQIKPTEVLQGTQLFHSFPELEGIHPNFKFESYFCSSKIAVQNKYLLAKRMGYNIEVGCNEDVYSLTFSTTNATDSFVIKRVINMGPTQDFVYDLETSDGTFQAGIGQMIVKNTDSCYVIFPQPVDPDGTLTTLFKVAENAAKRISATFKKPIELEFEKFMYPLILVAKKRYMYLEWTDPEKHNGEIEAKGVELVRRDNCPYVKETLDAVLQPIMFHNNVELGRQQAEVYIDKLLNGEVPIKKLILSKTLKNEYKGYQKVWTSKLLDGRPDTNGGYTWMHTKKNKLSGNLETVPKIPCMAHVALVEKMRLRDQNSAPKPGDRVPFVYTDINDPKALSWKKTEDPVYTVENGIPIDTLYYLDHQLKNPLKTIFDILLGEIKCNELFRRPSLLKAKEREKISIAEAKRKKEGNRDIRSFFTVKV
jgi:DNA polymerase delta subunit 1